MPRRGENIYKRKDGRWEGRYISGYNNSGSAKYTSVYAHTYTEVKRKLSMAKEHSAGNSTDAKSAENLERFAVMWLEGVRLQVKVSTYAKYRNLINNHISPAMGNLNIGEITTVRVSTFIDEKLCEGLSSKTVRDIISVLKLILCYAQSKGIRCVCDFDRLKIKVQSKNASVFTKEQCDIFTKYLLSEIDNVKLGILMSLYAGLRIGEVCALRFDDISDGVVHIKRTMQRVQTFDSSKRKTEVIITSPKSNCSIRDVPLPEFLNDVVQRLYLPNAFVLTGAVNKYMEPRTLENRFKAHLESCGMYRINYHAMRHTYATMCVECGVELKSLSEMLGHSSVNITLNRYVHASMDLKKEGVAKLNYSPSSSWSEGTKS